MPVLTDVLSRNTGLTAAAHLLLIRSTNDDDDDDDDCLSRTTMVMIIVITNSTANDMYLRRGDQDVRGIALHVLALC